MRYIRTMIFGMMLGSLASMLWSSKGGKSKQVMAKVKRTINLLAHVGREMSMAGRK